VEYLTTFPNGTFAAKPLAEIRMQDVKVLSNEVAFVVDFAQGHP